MLTDEDLIPYYEALETYPELPARKRALLDRAEALGCPAVPECGLAGGRALWGYRVVAAPGDALAALEAALDRREGRR